MPLNKSQSTVLDDVAEHGKDPVNVLNSTTAHSKSSSMPADLAAYGEGTPDTPAETVVNGTELVHVPADDTAVHGKGLAGVPVEVAAPWDTPC